MVTVTLTEPMVNAIGAALDQRIRSMTAQATQLAGHPQSSSRDFAIEATQEAIRDAVAAKLAICAALEDPEYPEDMTVARLSASDPSLVWHELLDR